MSARRLAMIAAVSVVAFTTVLVWSTLAVAHHSGGGDVTEAQQALRKAGYVLAVDGIDGPRTSAALRHWQRANGLAVTGDVDEATLQSLRGFVTALERVSDVVEVAKPRSQAAARRGGQVQVTPAPSAPPAGPGNLTGCDLMQWHRVNVGLPEYFDRIVYRESRCTADPAVRTFCCVGPLQLYVSLHLRDHRLAPRYAACGVRSEADVDGPDDIARHYCAAKALYDVVGDDAWALTR